MKKRILLAAVLAMALTLLCSCAQRVQEMDESGYEVYFLSDPASAGGEDAICAQRTRLALDDTMETEDCVRALMEALLTGPEDKSLRSAVPDGTTLKSLRFLLNVADEFAHSLRVHILRLQNRIRQQANARKRRFELVARIGYEAAARVLNGLQAIRHVVELGGKLADLVISADFGTVAVRAFAHFSNGVGQHAEAPRQHAG